MTASIGHNGGPPLEDEALPPPPGEPWFDLAALRMNGKPRRPMERTTSRTALWGVTSVEVPLLGRRIRGHADVKNSLEGGPLRRQHVTPWRPVPIAPYVMDTTDSLPRTLPGRLDHVANTNETKRLPYAEEHRAGRLTARHAGVIDRGLKVAPTKPPAIAVYLNSVLQKARGGADMKDLVPEHLDIAVKRRAEAGRIVLRNRQGDVRGASGYV
ncbi:hypothetical protein [Mesorhizobium sp. DCY119]|uniref:hypothetical protein n=1 Tax=Mesorhizobium sp. DCY119 TaxID=2108445 RepID=UPI000E6B64E1|nr:hypothetical protein [Mesorhizobium sp. DCY119]RJG44923.1 hypothetical protein D3Y55_12025 [Mesorhizobium sp. DCY119]